MQGTCITRYIRISPRKARRAANLVRGLDVLVAYEQLKHCGLKAGKILIKTLMSAVANAEAQHDVRREDLQISEVCIDVGPTLKRARSRNKGRKVPMKKRTSHIKVIVRKRS